MKTEVIIKYLELSRDILGWVAYAIWTIILCISIWNGINVEFGSPNSDIHIQFSSKPVKQLFYEPETK